MPRMIFLNLPVADAAQATAFYEAIGGTRNPMFSDEASSCMVFSDTIHVMLLSHQKFSQFIPGRKLGNPRDEVGMLICLSADSRDQVDAIVADAASAGGFPDPTPRQEHGDFMYGRSFQDPDGHMWEVMWMDLAAVPQTA